MSCGCRYPDSGAEPEAGPRPAFAFLCALCASCSGQHADSPTSRRRHPSTSDKVKGLKNTPEKLVHLARCHAGLNAVYLSWNVCPMRDGCAVSHLLRPNGCRTLQYLLPNVKSRPDGWESLVMDEAKMSTKQRVNETRHYCTVLYVATWP